MSSNTRPSLSFILFISAMLLLIAIGLFMLIDGSLHNPPSLPVVPGGGLLARGILHA